MKKDMLTFLTGLVAGVVLGLLVRDKDKERAKEAVSDQFNRMREKYDELAREGKELVSDQFNRMRGKYEEGKDLVADQFNRMRGKYEEGKEAVKEGIEKAKA